MTPILLLDSDIQILKLQECTRKFLSDHNLQNADQVTLTSVDGKDDWSCGNGELSKLPFPEEEYNKLNDSLTGTYIGSIILKYSNFYRWRLLKVAPKRTYSIHADAVSGQVNKRIHIPIVTNSDAFFVFYDQNPSDNSTTTIHSHNLKVGRVYEIDTSGFHTAVNYGLTDRYHLVGIRYE